MACIKLPVPPPLPTLGAIGLPSFSTPPFSGNLSLCCKFPPLNVPSLSTGVIPIPSAVLAPINAAILLVDAYIAALDLLQLSCPTQ